MSELTSLTELARFVGQSALSSEDALVHRRAVNAIAGRLESRPVHRSVTDLLAAVMTLSARTRRMVLPQVGIDLDVFAPGGGRAVRLTLPGCRQHANRLDLDRSGLR